MNAEGTEGSALLWDKMGHVMMEWEGSGGIGGINWREGRGMLIREGEGGKGKYLELGSVMLPGRGEEQGTGPPTLLSAVGERGGKC